MNFAERLHRALPAHLHRNHFAKLQKADELVCLDFGDEINVCR